MALRNPFGSIAALNLANPATQIAIGTVAGVAVTAVGVAIAYKAFEKYEEKEHKKKIKKINKLHDKYLVRINIPATGENLSLPVIFKLDESKPVSAVDSLHYTEEEVSNIGLVIPHGTDPSLDSYHEAILNAIRELKEYYLNKSNHQDITSGVISYLLNMLETRCMNFAGYDYDIGYLGALTKFINAYGSLKDTENSQHFSRLRPVYRYLKTAKQELEKHKEKLSLEDMLDDLKQACYHHNDLLIRGLTRFFTQSDDWKYIDNVTHVDLSNGILRKEYIHTEFKGIVFKKDPEVTIPDSIFKPWITQLAKYYLEIINSDTKLTKNDIKTPEQMFIIPDLNRLNELEKHLFSLKSRESTELSKLRKDAKSVRYIFEASNNFMTRILDEKSESKKAKFITVTDKKEMMERMNIFASFATLVHKVISLQYLVKHLMKSTQQLGEIYVKNPQHFCRIFSILNKLCDSVTEHTDKLKKSFIAIQIERLNTMQLEEKEQFPDEIQEILNSTYTSISTFGLRIKAYRDKVSKNLDASEPTVQSVKHEMFEIANYISEAYHFQLFLAGKLSDTDSNIEPAPVTKPVDAQSYPSTIIDPVQPEPVIAAEPVAPSNALVTLNKKMSAIYERILMIQHEKLPANLNTEALNHHLVEISQFKRINDQLIIMQKKAEAIFSEEHTSPERVDKSNKLVQLTTTICNHFLSFLQLDAEPRQKQASQFNRDMHQLLSDKQNDFIDDHANAFSKGVYSIANIGLFSTDTRKKLTQLGNTCDDLVKAEQPGI